MFGILRNQGRLKLYRPVEDPDPDLGFRVWPHKGEFVVITLWSAEVFAKLQDPPDDACQFPGGIWGRMLVVAG